jgi:hypothetical protein
MNNAPSQLLQQGDYHDHQVFEVPNDPAAAAVKVALARQLAYDHWSNPSQQSKSDQLEQQLQQEQDEACYPNYYPMDHNPMLDANQETCILFFNNNVQVNVAGQPITAATDNGRQAASRREHASSESSSTSPTSHDADSSSATLDLRGRKSLWEID